MTYKNSSAGLQLESANFGSGVIRANVASGMEVNYFLTDHLGSVRVIVDGSGVVKERNDYYPFGAKHARGDYPQLAANRYKYNGKEEQVTGDLGYLDYGWRMHDKALGRWFSMDKLSEMMPSISGYAYALNNPVKYRDLFGLFPVKDPIAYEINHPTEIVITPDGSYYRPIMGAVWYYPGMDFGKDREPDWDDMERRAIASAQSLVAEREQFLRKLETDFGSLKQTLDNTRSMLDFMDFIAGSARLGMGGVDLGSDAMLMNTSRAYSFLGKGSRMLGRANWVISSALIVLETKELTQGKISPGRYTYHVSSGVVVWITSTKIGATYGGAWGAVGGFVVGGAFASGEIMYDRGKEFHEAGHQYMNNLTSKISSGAFMYGF